MVGESGGVVGGSGGGVIEELDFVEYVVEFVVEEEVRRMWGLERRRQSRRCISRMRWRRRWSGRRWSGSRGSGKRWSGSRWEMEWVEVEWV